MSYGPGYGYGYGYPSPSPQVSGKATAVLVLGIVSLVLTFSCGFGFIPAIIGVVMAPGAKREIRDSGGWITGSGMVTAGQIISWITIGLTVLAILALVLLFMVGAFASTGTSGTSGGGFDALPVLVAL